MFCHITKWTHHCYQWIGCQPTIVTIKQGVSPPLLLLGPRLGFSIGLAGLHLSMIIPVIWWQVGFHFQIITGKHCFNYIISLCFIEMRAQPSVSSIILLYRDESTGFRLTFQNIFVFLGNGVRRIFPSFRRYLQPKTTICSQCTLAWHEDFIGHSLCQSSHAISLVRKDGGNVSIPQDFRWNAVIK